MMGQIALEGMQFYAYHGYYHEERVVGKQFIVDVYIDGDLSAAATSDSLKKTINYEKIYDICKQEMKQKSNLLEHVASRILDKIGAEYPDHEKIKVRISKLHPPVKGNVERVYVELER